MLEFLNDSADGSGRRAPLLASICIGFTAFIAIYLLRSAYTNLVRSPLRRFPGPLLARLSRVWLTAVTFSGRRAYIIHALHQRYGPVVRIAPDELSFASAAAAHDIYIGVDDDAAAAEAEAESAGTSALSRDKVPGPKNRVGDSSRRSGHARATRTFPKSPNYDIYPPTIFGLRDEAAHRARLRRVGHCFSPSLLPDVESLMRTELANLLRILEERRGKECDMHHLSRYYALDVSGQLFLGKSFGALTGSEPPLFLRYLDSAFLCSILKRRAPPLFMLLQYLPIKSLRQFLASADGLYEFGAVAVNEFIARHGRSPARRLPLARLITGNAEQGVPPLPDAMIGDEVTVMLFAGTDTTASTLTYLLFELARHPDWYARVRAEVQAAAAAAAADAAPDTKPLTASSGAEKSRDSSLLAADEQQQQQQQKQLEELPPFVSLNTLPVLNAVLWETLRFYPPAPGSLMRVAPRGGARVADAGCWLPAGTGTSVQVYTLQRNADVFPQPDAWQPARWLATTESPNVPLTSLLSSSLSSATPCAGDAGAKGGSIANVSDELVVYETDAMRQHMLVFSKGPRSCLGKSIALMELKLATAAIAQRFTTLGLGHAQQTVDDMLPVDNVVVTPKGERCNLVFG